MLDGNFVIGFCNFHVVLVVCLYLKQKGRPVFLSFTTSVSRNVWGRPASEAMQHYVVNK